MPDTYCPNCHATVAAGRFCSNCARPLIQEPHAAPTPVYSKTGKSLSPGLLILTILILLFAFGVCVMVFSGKPLSQSTAQTSSTESSTITLAKFNRLSEGMTYNQVVAVLGKDGTVISSTNIGGIKTVMYQWNAGLIANMNAMFQDGKMISKAQFGLE
jgi:hypothetical protein